MASSVEEEMREILEKRFAPDALTIKDESHRHAGHTGAPEGGQSHFRVTLVTKAFEGLPKVQRHRQVYAALANIIPHALALKTLTPEEFKGDTHRG